MLKPATVKTASALKLFSQNRLTRVGAPLLILVAIALGTLNFAGSGCSEHYRSDKVLTTNGHKLYAQVASTYDQQTKGLSGRQCLGKDQAMLFSFDRPSYLSFWMHGMRFPLDIVWLSRNKKVVYLKNDLSPKTAPQSFTNEQPTQYVIELNAGSIQKFGIGIGSAITF